MRGVRLVCRGEHAYALRCAGARNRARGQKATYGRASNTVRKLRACTHSERVCDRAALCVLGASAPVAEVKGAALVTRPHACVSTRASEDQSAAARRTAAHLWQRGARLSSAHTAEHLRSSACCIAATAGCLARSGNASCELESLPAQIGMRIGAPSIEGPSQALPSHWLASVCEPPTSVRERLASVSRTWLKVLASGPVKSMVAAMAASISCRPAPLRVFAARRPARPIRAGFRVFAAVDKVQVRLWVFLAGNVPECRATGPADWQQMVGTEAAVLSRNAPGSGSCLACADCLITFTQLTDCALVERPVAALGFAGLLGAVQDAARLVAATAYHMCAAGAHVGAVDRKCWLALQCDIVDALPSPRCGSLAFSLPCVWLLAARLAGLARVCLRTTTVAAALLHWCASRSLAGP